jgi:hypothetical protein
MVSDAALIDWLLDSDPALRWVQGHRYPGRAWFGVDVPPGEPSKWLTFYGTRALHQWDAASPS